jgi:hypothetical protein
MRNRCVAARETGKRNIVFFFIGDLSGAPLINTRDSCACTTFNTFKERFLGTTRLVQDTRRRIFVRRMGGHDGVFKVQEPKGGGLRLAADTFI